MANEGIRFAQSAIDRFIQFKMIQLQQQREDERTRRFDLSLQQNRRFNQERIDIAREAAVETKAFRTRTAVRLEDTAESLKQYREAQIGAMGDRKPFTEGRIQQTLGEMESGGSTSIYGHVMQFRDRAQYIDHALRKLGPDWLEIAPEAAEIINKRFPDEPQISATRTFQPSAFPRAESETRESLQFQTTPQDSSIAFPPKTPDTGATILGGAFAPERIEVRDKEGKKFTIPRKQLPQALSEGYEEIGQDFLPPDPDEGIFDRLEAPEISAEKRTQAIDFVKSVLRQDKYAELDNDAKIEIGIRMLGEQGIKVESRELSEVWQVP